MAIRERREELSTVIPYASGAQQVFTGGIPRDRPLTRLHLMLEGRMVTTAGNFFPEAPASLIRNVQLRGTKVTGGGTVTLINARGTELHRLSSFYEATPALGIEVVDEAAAGGVKFPANPGIGSTAAAAGAATYDFRVNYVLPIAPRFATINDELAGVTDPSIYSQLDLLVQFGTGTADLTSAGAVTLSAFGSGAGNPQVVVSRFSPLLGKSRAYNKWHYTLLSKYINNQNNSATANDTKITDLNIGNWVRYVQLRQYAENAGVQGLIDQLAGDGLGREGDGVNPGTFRWRVKLNGSEIFRMRHVDLREHNRYQFNRTNVMPEGYAVIDFTERGFMGTAFDTRGYGAAAARYELFGDWTGLTAADRLDVAINERIPVKV